MSGVLDRLCAFALFCCLWPWFLFASVDFFFLVCCKEQLILDQVFLNAIHACTCPDFECDFAVGVDAVEGGDRLRVAVLEAASSILLSFTTFRGDSLRDVEPTLLHK